MDRRHRATSAEADDAAEGRLQSDRRARGERRRSRGLLELRARREGSDGDRRRDGGVSQKARRRWLALWRRVRP
ncbi:MAG: hypothetical protein RIC56_18305 [Pseudomonadales bacterium]